MIYTAFYYPASIKKGDLFIRDNRFYPGKYIETFPLWYQYVMKNYPDEYIYMFYDVNSPYKLEDLGLIYGDDQIVCDKKKGTDLQIYVHELKEHSSKYFWTMQRNICEGLIRAYETGNDFFWLDNDAFLNTDLSDKFNTYDVVAPNINHQQFTIDSVCTFFSNKQLHKLDRLCHLPTYLRNILNNAPENVRAHTFQEGGLYKMFCYGNVYENKNLNLSHLSNYNNLLKFLKKNPLNSKEYTEFLNDLENVDKEKLKGVELDFLDMYYEEVA